MLNTFSENLPFCLRPIIIDSVPKNGTSTKPDDEFPITQFTDLINDNIKHHLKY